MKHGAPDLYTPEQLMTWPVGVEINGRYVAGRPLGWQGWSLKWRLKLAWGVFVGKYDALKWEGQ